LFISSGDVLIYGSTVDVYTCVQSLIALGLPADRIVIIEPYNTTEVLIPMPPSIVYEFLHFQTSCFNNRTVEEAMMLELKNLGVRVHSGYFLAQVNDEKESEGVTRIASAAFISPLDAIQLECCVRPFPLF
jgi:ABC-type thiamin/hydroxymethylpyrimidine transport system permease subunit